MRKKELRLFLLVRADGRASPSSLLAALRLLPEAPVHWALPSCPLSGPEAAPWLELLDEVEKGRPRDRVISMGYSGAPHPLLQLEELRREVEWGLHASGDAGRRFRPIPGVLAPLAADLVRPQALKLYASKGIRLLVVPSADGEAGVLSGALLQVLPCREATAALAESARRLAAVAECGPGVLCVSAEAAGAASLRVLLDRLGSRARVQTLDQEIDLPVTGSPACFASDPVARGRATSVSAFRTHRQGSDETASVLQVLAGLREVAGPSRSVGVFPSPRRENTTVMMGAVSLTEGPLAAHFESGRLCGLAWTDRFASPAAPCRSYAGASRKPRLYEVTAAFALEADRVRGLRVLHRLPGDPSILTIEHFFVESFPYLLVTGRVRYPARRGLQGITPLEVAAARLPRGGDTAVHVVCRGEAPYRVPIRADCGPMCLSGSLFWFEGPGGGLLAGFPPVKEPALDSVRLRFERQNDILFASFFSTHGSACGSAGREELFSLYLGIAFEPPSEVPVFPRAVLNEIPYHAVSG